MKRILIVLVAFLGLSLGSCQCSDKPEIGPVESGQASLASAPFMENV